MNIGYIKAKSNGMSLFEHTSAVLQTAMILSDKYKGDGINPDVMRYASIFHDLGKANPLFQSNMSTNNFENVCRHEISSILFIDNIPEPIRDEVAKIILTHHKSFNDKEVNSFFYLDNEYEDKLYDNHINGIEKWGKDVKDFLQVYFDIQIEIPSKERCVEIISEYLNKFSIQNLSATYNKYVGLFKDADHFGSAFPFEHDRAMVFKTLFRIPDTSLYDAKDERYPLSFKEKDTTKKHTMVIAPCGAGKTNIMMKCCTKRIFYLLPFQASINAMYKRLTGDLGDNYSYAIKHASISTLPFIDDNVRTMSGLFGSSLIVETPFQVMPIILRNKGYESLIMDIKGQDVIFDEIHTYTTKVMSMTLILNLICLLKALDCNIHICSATMPSYLQKKLIDILGENDTQVIKLTDNELDSFNRHIIHTENKRNMNDMVDDIIERYHNGEKVLVVRNQVKLSQHTYIQIKERCPNANIMLIHGRYRRMDRNALESKLMDVFNKEDKPCIVVSTQVVEVSIDINFDCMFTDVADIMNLIQRFGRINRQRVNTDVRKDVFVVNINSERDCDFMPYQKDVCENTFKALHEVDGMELREASIQCIIDKVHPTLTSDINENIACPIVNGKWVKKECINELSKLDSLLDFDTSVGILEKDMDEYVKTKNPKYEIPIRLTKARNSGFIEYSQNSQYSEFWIIPDNIYDSEIGLMR